VDERAIAAVAEVRAVVTHRTSFDKGWSEPGDVLGVGVGRWHGDEWPDIVLLQLVMMIMMREANIWQDANLARGGRLDIHSGGRTMVRPVFLNKRETKRLTEDIGEMNGLRVQSFSTRAMKFRFIVVIEIR